MTRYVVLVLASVGGLFLGVVLGVAIAALTEPTDAVVATQVTATSQPDAKSQPVTTPAPAEPATTVDATTDPSDDVRADETAADYEKLAQRRDENIAAVGQALVVVESYGCGVAVRGTGLGLDAGTVLVPSVISEASWYVAVDEAGFTMPDHLLVAGMFPAIKASTANSIAAAAVPFGSLAPDEEATLLWAENGSSGESAVGTVIATTASSFEIQVTSPVGAAAIGGAVVNAEGALVGLVESVDNNVVAGRPLTSVSQRDAVEPAPRCVTPTGQSVTEPFGAFNAELRPEIKALLVFQLEEDHLANGDYDEAQAMDATLAKLSWNQMTSGWSVTDDSFVVPVHWSNVGGDVQWRLGLVTHETDGTSKLFCVSRSYDDPARTVTRATGGSSLVFERRPGWVEPNEVLEEIRAAC